MQLGLIVRHEALECELSTSCYGCELLVLFTNMRMSLYTCRHWRKPRPVPGCCVPILIAGSSEYCLPGCSTTGVNTLLRGEPDSAHEFIDGNQSKSTSLWTELPYFQELCGNEMPNQVRNTKRVYRQIRVYSS